jgi:tripartite ATP-independent transporter DctM subunit
MKSSEAVATRLNGKFWLLMGIPVLLLVAIPLAAMSLWEPDVLLDAIIEYLPVAMFFLLALFLFTGFPVAFVLGGIALTFGFLGYALGIFSLIEFFNFVPRIWGQAAENLVLVAVPTFVFMGVMMERSGIAEDLLYATQVLLRRVPGSLALAVTVMGTILAAMTGIIGASVTMMTALALPTMLRQRYSHALATGCICASGTLGILIPPSIMLIIMADLLSVSVGTLFMAALGPGLMLAGLYMIYIATLATVNPRVAPPLPRELLYVPMKQMPNLIFKSFLPPAFLLAMVKGSILFGWATPSEAGAVGAFGAFLLAWVNKRLTWDMLKGVNYSSALTVSMIFFIVMSATCFAYVFRSLGGDDSVSHLILEWGLDSWGLLLLIMFIVFILGFFLDWIEITLIILPIFAPIVAGFDFGAHVPHDDIVIWFTVLLAVNLQTSFLTPPFGFALFYMKGIAPEEVHITSIYRGIIPFVILQVCAVLLVMMFPQLALTLPHSVFG